MLSKLQYPLKVSSLIVICFLHYLVYPQGQIQDEHPHEILLRETQANLRSLNLDQVDREAINTWFIPTLKFYADYTQEIKQNKRWEKHATYCYKANPFNKKKPIIDSLINLKRCLQREIKKSSVGRCFDEYSRPPASLSKFRECLFTNKTAKEWNQTFDVEVACGTGMPGKDPKANKCADKLSYFKQKHIANFAATRTVSFRIIIIDLIFYYAKVMKIKNTYLGGRYQAKDANSARRNYSLKYQTFTEDPCHFLNRIEFYYQLLSQEEKNKLDRLGVTIELINQIEKKGRCKPCKVIPDVSRELCRVVTLPLVAFKRDLAAQRTDKPWHFLDKLKKQRQYYKGSHKKDFDNIIRFGKEWRTFLELKRNTNIDICWDKIKLEKKSAELKKIYKAMNPNIQSLLEPWQSQLDIALSDIDNLEKKHCSQCDVVKNINPEACDIIKSFIVESQENFKYQNLSVLARIKNLKSTLDNYDTTGEEVIKQKKKEEYEKLRGYYNLGVQWHELLNLILNLKICAEEDIDRINEIKVDLKDKWELLDISIKNRLRSWSLQLENALNFVVLRRKKRTDPCKQIVWDEELRQAIKTKVKQIVADSKVKELEFNGCKLTVQEDIKYQEEDGQDGVTLDIILGTCNSGINVQDLPSGEWTSSAYQNILKSIGGFLGQVATELDISIDKMDIKIIGLADGTRFSGQTYFASDEGLYTQNSEGKQEQYYEIAYNSNIQNLVNQDNLGKFIRDIDKYITGTSKRFIIRDDTTYGSNAELSFYRGWQAKKIFVDELRTSGSSIKLYGLTVEDRPSASEYRGVIVKMHLSQAMLKHEGGFLAGLLNKISSDTYKGYLTKEEEGEFEKYEENFYKKERVCQKEYSINVSNENQLKSKIYNKLSSIIPNCLPGTYILKDTHEEKTLKKFCELICLNEGEYQYSPRLTIKNTIIQSIAGRVKFDSDNTYTFTSEIKY